MKSMPWILFFFSALVFAQAPDGKDSRPSDGAIKGGSVLPGETSGRPDARPAPTPSRGADRCNELSGSLREQCLEQEHKGAAGATRAPGEPPLQEPRQEKQ